MLQELAVDILRPFYFCGKGRLLNSLVCDHGERVAHVAGNCMRLDLSDYIQRSIYLGCFEPRETRLVRRWLRPGMTFVDIGANVGYYTLLAASCVGSAGSVVAFEPSLYAYKRMAETVQINQLTQVHPIHAGLSDIGGEVTLYIPPESFHNHSPSMVPNNLGSPITVSVRTLDQYLDEFDIKQVDLLKIDVEGYEPKVFAGAKSALASRRIRAILCEFNDYWLREMGSSPQALWRKLTQAGFEDASHPGVMPSFSPGCVVNHFLSLR